MENQLLYDFEAKCVQEEAPACQSSCPLHVDGRSFAKLMASGQTLKARQVLDKLLPLSCLTVFLCEGICQNSCRVKEIPESGGQGVNINLLERACVLNSPTSKMMPFPSSRKKVALIGGGLSSLVLAFELNKKGHQCTLFHTQDLGADILSHNESGAEKRLANINHDNLTSAVINAISILKSIKVNISQVPEISRAFLQACLENEEENYHAVFLSYDDSTVKNSDIFTQSADFSTPNPISLVTSHPKVLTGGFSNKENALYIECIADGKRATGSIERIMQGVDPTIKREKEDPYSTKLYTNLESMVSCRSTQLTDPARPTLTEATEEAKRCIDCSCLECLKQCTFLTHYKSYPKRYIREVYNNVAIIKGTRVANTMINSCTQCGLCEKICPQGLNMGEFLNIARRELVEYKRMPPSAHEFALDDMVSTLTPDVQFIRMPQENTSSLKTISTFEDIQNTNFMFFSGCQLPAVLPREVEAVHNHLAQYLCVGFHFACCGIPAQWAGNTTLLQKTIANFKHKWKEAKHPTYIFACTSCAEFFKTHCPEVNQISLWEILEKLPLPKTPKSLSFDTLDTLIIHDPCSVRNVPQTYTAVRVLLNKIGQQYKELSFSKELTRCCGNGGLAAEVAPVVGDEFVLNRMADIKEDIKKDFKQEINHELNNTDILLVYCAICRERYQKKGQRALHLLELLFSDSIHTVEKNSLACFLKIYERQDNRLVFRKNILKNIYHEELSQEEKNMEKLVQSIKLNISEEVEKVLDERRILRTDILKVIWATLTNEQAQLFKENNSESPENLENREKNISEFSGEDISVFQNTANSHSLAAYRPRLVTYWVEYMLEDDGSYTIFDAYSHRMIVPGVRGKGEDALYKMCCK